VHMKLDDVELLKREDKSGAVKEIRSVYNLSVYGKRSIVELPIPGAEGNVFQDMGRDPSIISFEGTLIGPGAETTLKALKAKFDLNEPVAFSSDIALVSDITKVVIEELAIRFTGGVGLGVSYSMVLKEHNLTSKTSLNSTAEKSPESETEPPSQEESAKEEVERKVEGEREQLEKKEKERKRKKAGSKSSSGEIGKELGE
jgi:hypothetical protein